MYTVEAHTDGSCLGNPGPGGWAVKITKVLKDGKLFAEDEDTFSGSCAYLTTNNAMEINAVNNLLSHISSMGYPEGTLIKVYVDSEYVLKVVRMGKDKATDPSRANHQFWDVFFDLVNGLKYKVEFYWEKAHANNLHNNKVNDIAQRRAKLAKEKMDFESKL